MRALNGMRMWGKGLCIASESIKWPSPSAKIDRPCLENKQTKPLKMELYHPKIVMLGI